MPLPPAPPQCSAGPQGLTGKAMRYEVQLVVGTCHHPQARLPSESQPAPRMQEPPGGMPRVPTVAHSEAGTVVREFCVSDGFLRSPCSPTEMGRVFPGTHTGGSNKALSSPP